MKWWAILVLCILFSPYVLGTDITLGLGESHIYNGANITFAKLDNKNDKVVLCVNNQKQILDEDQLTYFSKDGKNFMELEVDHIDLKDKTIDIDIGWTNVCDEIYCECVGDCLNDECKIQMYDEWGSPLIKENKTEVVDEPEEKDIVDETVIEEKTNYIMIISLIILIGCFIGLFLVWLFWFR